VVNAVTLEVTPDEAEKLDLARSVGTLSLVLRNQVDRIGGETRGIMKAQLLAGDTLRAEPAKAEPAKPVVKRKPVPTTGATGKVEMIKGVHTSTMTVPSGSQQ
jgi:pilus assembly protein CpaB